MANKTLALLACALMVFGPVAGVVGAVGGQPAGAAGGQPAGAAGGQSAEVAGRQPAEAVGGQPAGVAGGQSDGTADTATAEETTQATEISSCTTISQSGVYELAENVTDSSADACIRIRASNVVLKGGGHAIDGVSDFDPERLSERFFGGQNPFQTRNPVGVRIGGGRTVSNVTVQNLTVTDWRWGVLATDLRTGGIVGVRATDNALGVAAVGSRNVAVLDTTANDNAGIGVTMLGVRNGRVTNVTASGNGVMGVYYSRGASARISSVVARNNDFAGVLVEGAPGSTVVDATASGSRIGVYMFATSGGQVRGVTATDNRFAGIYAAEATGTTIADSVATDNGLSGVLLQNTTGATVQTTNSSQSRYGIYLFFAEETRVTNSTANDGVMGVFVRNSSDAAVVNNTVLDNSFDGVYVENSTQIRVESNRDGALTFASTGNETIGREGGYSANATIDVNQSDGLSEAELRAYVYRAIARAEELRDLEYIGEISFEVVSQEELERRNEAEPASSETVAAWENQLWEATFVVGEDRNATAVFANESSRVAGFYNSYADKMVIVSDDRPLTVSSTTLVHEFVHVLQDQHFDLTRPEIQPRTQDRQRARNGLVEGDARYVEERFEQLCGVVWSCIQVDSEEPPGGEVSETRNFALRQLILAPYSDGPNYVNELRERGGWDAVNDAYDDPLNTTEQLLHSDKRDEPPIPLDFEDTARGDWERFNQSNLSFSGVDGTTTVGEVGIFTMFWYQGYEYGNEIVGVNDHLYPNDPTFDWFDYVAEPSEGWGNDVLVPYSREVVNGTEYGYVWRTAWDTPEDAREFHRAYRDLLRGQGAQKVGPNTWAIGSGPYEDAFRVVRDGANVTIVNAPTVGGLADLRPGLAPSTSADADGGADVDVNASAGTETSANTTAEAGATAEASETTQANTTTESGATERASRATETTAT